MLVVIKQSLPSSQKNLELVGLCKCENIWQTQHLKMFLVIVYGNCEKNIYYHKSNTWGKPYEKTMLLQFQHDGQHGNLQKNSIVGFSAMLLKYNV
jgi:hypothetical protein